MFQQIYSKNGLKLYVGDFQIDNSVKEVVEITPKLSTEFRKRSTSNKYFFVIKDGNKTYISYPNSTVFSGTEISVSEYMTEHPELNEVYEDFKWNIVYSKDNIQVKESKLFFNNPRLVTVEIDGKTYCCNPYKTTLPPIIEEYFKNHKSQFNEISEYFSEAIKDIIK